MEDIIKSAMTGVASLADSDKVNLKGKTYTMVAQRVQAFRAAAGVNGQILTDIVEQSDQKVVVKASVSIWREADAQGWAGGWSVVATDFAEEYRNQGPVNKTSALENCCTSAIGRALSAAGLSGGEYASSFEVDNAINHKPAAVAKKPAPAKAAPTPAVTPVTDEVKAVEPVKPTAGQDDLNIVADGMIEAMKIHKDVNSLRSFYTANGENLTRMKEELPEKHKELVTKMKEYSATLTENTEQSA
jgi:hypothetical protein